MILMFVASLAGATDYNVELAIPSTHPSWLAAGAKYGAGRMLVQVSHPNGSMSAADPRVICYVKSGWLQVDFEADRSTYPTAPFSTSCTYGTDTLNINVVYMSAATDPSLQDRTIQVDNTIQATRVTGARWEKLYELPACSAGYQLGTVDATLSGVRCRVESIGGVDYVRLKVSPTASLGLGSCVLPLGDSTSYTLGLDLSEAGI